MQTILRYPIYPSIDGMTVEVPEGAKLLGVTLSSNTYYLHALHKVGGPLPVGRHIIALRDDSTHPDCDLGQYLGRCEQAGDARGWHFFAQGGAQ